MLLHGGTNTAWDWYAVAEDLAIEREVVAVDLRGHGRSDWAEAYPLDLFVDDLERVRSSRGWETLIPVGLSLGALVVARYGERFPHRTRRLALVEVGPDTLALVRARDSGAPDPPPLPVWDSPEAAVAVGRAASARPSDAMIRCSVLANLRQQRDGRWTPAFDPRFAGFRILDQWPDEPAVWSTLLALHCPVLVVRGGDSPLLSRASAERMAGALPGGRFVEIAGAGHGVCRDRPLELAGALRAFIADG